MSRTIKDIYQEAIRERNKRLELSEFSSDSKLSIMNGITWFVAAMIYSFESILDVFAIDISETISNRINGTATYYANALLKYQSGDELIMREDGLAWGYPNQDETKRIITQVSYAESSSDNNLDNKLVLKIATGSKGNLSEISSDELVPITKYINLIKFAGTRIEVVSRKGDILIPRVTVYYNGAVLESEIYDAIEDKLNEYMISLEFDSAVYASKVLDYISKAENVTDVYIDPSKDQGIYLASYDSDGQLLTGVKSVNRVFETPSGYLRQSSGRGVEQDLPNFRQAISLVIDSSDEI